MQKGKEIGDFQKIKVRYTQKGSHFEGNVRKKGHFEGNVRKLRGMLTGGHKTQTTLYTPYSYTYTTYYT